MPHLEYFLVAEDISIDQATNRTSVFNVLEQVGSPNFPTAVPKATALSLWSTTDDDDQTDQQALLRVTLPDQVQHSFSVNFRFTQRRHRIAHRIAGLPLRQEGKLVFEVFLNSEPRGRYTVDVVEQPEEYDEAVEIR